MSKVAIGAVIVIVAIVMVSGCITDEISETMEEAKETAEETKETMEEAKKVINETSQRAQEILAPPEITNVNIETTATSATISWNTTKDAVCELKVERVGELISEGVSRGEVHKKVIRALLPGEEYNFVIEAKSETGSDSYSGTFETKTPLPTSTQTPLIPSPPF